MTMTATLIDDREDDRLYRMAWELNGHALVSRYGSAMYKNQMTCIWSTDASGEARGAPLATYYGAVTHDEALRKFGAEVLP